MEGLFDLMIIGFILYATLRGMMRAGRKGSGEAGQPSPQARPQARTRDPRRGEAREELDWDEAIGDVLEGLGLPRPPASEPPSGRREAPPEPVVLRRQHFPPERPARAERPTRSQRPAQTAEPADDRTLIEVAGLAEQAARLRERVSRAPAPTGAKPPSVRRPESQTASTAAGEPESAAPAPPAAGLKRLEGRSELERAILYAEILGPPKAFRE